MPVVARILEHATEADPDVTAQGFDQADSAPDANKRTLIVDPEATTNDQKQREPLPFEVQTLQVSLNKAEDTSGAMEQNDLQAFVDNMFKTHYKWREPQSLVQIASSTNF